MDIYFVRHGETLWNKNDIIQGHLDSPLTEKGREMAKILRKKSKDLKFTKVYSSDLGRAYETAKLICPSKPIIKTELLREIDVGSWSGKNFKDIEKEDPILYYNYFKRPEIYNRIDGESFYDLNARVKKFFDGALNENQRENILIVSHGITIVSIFNLMEKKSVKDFWYNRVRRNAEFNIARYEKGEFTIIKKAPLNPKQTI
ncbi:histidine phosphatase family protein [Peptoniphilus raoultii]|uniref:histidine phosphatase family protein n=1 Tax=Peptoniphilus raoultii TaxID=1776387 RepID=UPI0008DA0A68|nr:histidine phosphatase family protein [Peptoniphilus raoultii]